MKKSITVQNNLSFNTGLCDLKTWGLALLMAFTATLPHTLNAQVTPFHYWTFDNSSSPMKDSMANCNLNPAYYQCVYIVNGAAPGSVGRSLGLESATGRAIVASTNFIPDSILTIEFLYKSAPGFNLTEFVRRRDGAFNIRIGYPFIQFTTNVRVNGTAVNDVFKIDLEGIGRGSYGYYSDGNWHHMVFKYNGKTGAKEVWVDGQLPAGFSKAVTKGAFNPNTTTPNNNIIDINSNTSYNKLSGSLDEIAFYKADLSGGMIYKHYTEAAAGLHYTFSTTTGIAPTAASIVGTVNPDEYAPGHPTYSVNALEQLRNFPLPRYKPTHTLTRNFNWIGMDYFSGFMQPNTSTSTAVANSVNIQKELAGNWNYFLLVTGNTGSFSTYTDPARFNGAWVQLANQNPQWGASAISFWNQLNPIAAGYSSNVGYVEHKSLPNIHYLRNSSGQYLTTSGSVTTSKFISPAAPLDSLQFDGNTQRFYFQKLFSSLTRPLDIISENGEVIPKFNTTAMSLDPAVVNDKNSTGLDWDTYQGNRKARLAILYRDRFMSLPQLAQTYYGEYQISGHTTRHKYSETRNIQKLKNGQRYATPDFYPRWPSNWLTGTGPWNGWQHIIDGRSVEIGLGDKLFSPYIAAGWNGDEERNIRPAQWLGLMKALSGLGAEFYYTGYFNEASSYNPPNPAPNDPSGYAWQAVIPSYAQAITSRFEDILRNGTLLNGDMPNNYSSPNGPGYTFNCGDLRKLVVIRKDNNTDRYVICTTLQPNSNMTGNAELEGDAKITLNNQSLQFKVRRQGSTYVYDNSNPQAPVFYQLDGWHESKHPYYWSKDFQLEAELYDNAPSNLTIATRVPAGTSAGDFRNYTTSVKAVSASATMPVLEYRFTPRNQPVYYFWIKARSVNGSASSMKISLNGKAGKDLGCITDTTFKWYSIESCTGTAISFSNLTNIEQRLSISPEDANLEIDQILLTADQFLNLNNNQVACSGSIATVTASGTLSVCNGKSVTLTAPAATSYAWSNGETTQSIIVTVAGNYSVSVNNGGSCNSISPPVTVASLGNPVINITGDASFCSGNTANLTATGGATYLWSNGETTPAITISQGGLYSITATDNNGCSSSQVTSVTENALPTATISAAANDLSIIPSIKLNASGGDTYVWQPGGETTATITVTTPGTYIVIASTTSGCTAISQPFIITQNSSVTIQSSGATEFCEGGSATLTASGASSYLWSPGGATTSSIVATESGLYHAYAVDINGNVLAIDSMLIQVNPAPMQPFISMTYIPGNAYQLVASEPSAVEYIWSSGATSALTTYYAPANVTVRVKNNFGCISAPVAIQVADPMITGCNTPDMLMYSNASDTSVVLQWNPAVQATQFTIRYQANGSTVINERTVAGNVSNVRLNGLTVNTLYNWTVEAVCSGSVLTSQTSTFTTLGQQLACGSQPMHTSAKNIQPRRATLTWYTTEADSFNVRFRTAGATTFRNLQVAGNSTNGTTLSGLKPGTTYEWQVRSFCSGYTSAFTPSAFFTTTDTCGFLGDVSIVQMRPNSVTLKWGNTSPMDSIRIRITNVVTGARRTVKLNYNPTTGTYRVNGLQANTQYYAELRGTCSNGVVGAWTQPLYFTTPGSTLREGDPLQLNAYPNPASDLITYSFNSESDEPYSIRVCDMSGRQLMQEIRQAQTGTSTNEIPVSSYAKGIYLMIITQGTMTGHFRFSVQ
jgi:hypothetical protein